MKLTIIPANEHHGVYLIDELGQTVCDFYFMKDGKPVHHSNAQLNANVICQLWNNKVEK